MVMRQTFFGGSYGLTDSNNMPNPVSLKVYAIAQTKYYARLNLYFSILDLRVFVMRVLFADLCCKI